MAPTATLTFGTIPELLIAMGHHLDPPDLAKCVLVSRLWNASLTPRLWTTIDDSQYGWPRLFRKFRIAPNFNRRDWASDLGDVNNDNNGQEWIQYLMKKHGQHVRNLKTQWPVFINAAYADRCCTQLRTLIVTDFRNKDVEERIARANSVTRRIATEYTWRHGMGVKGPLIDPMFENDALTPTMAVLRSAEDQVEDWLIIQRLWLLIRQNLDLRILHLEEKVSHLCTVSQWFVCETLSSLPNLTEFNNGIIPTTLHEIMEAVPTTLRTLHIGRLTFQILPCPRKYDHLWSFHLNQTIKPEGFYILLLQLPNLDNLWLLAGFTIMNLPIHWCNNILVGLTSRLRQFYLGNTPWGDDSSIAEFILPCLPDLIQFSVPLLHSKTAQALVTCCPDLKRFSQTQDGNGLSPDVWMVHSTGTLNSVFTGCLNLTVLDAINHRLTVRDFDNIEWRCRSLEVFRCQIIGLCRVTHLEKIMMDEIIANDLVEPHRRHSKAENELKEKYDRYQENHYQVYAQLARLTKLKILDLGYQFKSRRITHWTWRPLPYGVRYNEPLPGTLELSLRSGLNQLKTLANLEVFGFECVDHQIEELEIEWMATNWPRLRVMRGLQDRTAPGPITCPGRYGLRMRMAQLRPEIRHETISRTS
ncbi:hypothetical protein FBU30_007703 [Linnemannia zychae]|nr:hypothetical protein FBU30_007703 [Linnemannia zychae]